MRIILSNLKKTTLKVIFEDSKRFVNQKISSFLLKNKSMQMSRRNKKKNKNKAVNIIITSGNKHKISKTKVSI